MKSLFNNVISFFSGFFSSTQKDKISPKKKGPLTSPTSRPDNQITNSVLSYLPQVLSFLVHLFTGPGSVPNSNKIEQKNDKKIIYTYNSRDKGWIKKQLDKEKKTLSDFFKYNLSDKPKRLTRNTFLIDYQKQFHEVETKYSEKLKEIEKSELDFLNSVNSIKRKKKES